MTLYSKLKNYPLNDGRSLEQKFEDIARTILYDGYLKVRNDYRIYIKTVEFYMHAEEGSPFNVSDPIVYHRNGKFHGRMVPYFPLMSLHAHMSGFDITFENEKLLYRASALIRAYAVFDVKANKFINLKNNCIYDDRSTYLYDYLNGFSCGEQNEIVWVDQESTIEHVLNPPAPRRNVFEYDGENKTSERDKRLWSFTRKNEVTVL